MATKHEYESIMSGIRLSETAQLQLAEPFTGGGAAVESRVAALERNIAALERSGGLREAAPLHGDVKARLSKAVQNAHPDDYASYVDHTGDGSDGDVIYQVRGETRQAPYSLSKVDGVASTKIDTAKAKKVVGSTNYSATESERLREGADLARLMNTPGPMASRICSEGRRGFDPNYCSTDRQEPESEDRNMHEFSGLSSMFGRTKAGREVFERGRTADCNPLG